MVEGERGMGEVHGCGTEQQREYWSDIYERFHDGMRDYLARHVAHPDDADDLVQEIFVSMIASRCRPENLQAYVHVTTRHQLWAYWRRRRNRGSKYGNISTCHRNDAVADAMDASKESDPAEILCRWEMRSWLDSMIGNLSPCLGEIVRMRIIDGLEMEQAVLRTGCERSALQKRLTRAKRVLGNRLASWERPVTGLCDNRHVRRRTSRTG